jgi:hypothetical protein
MGKELYLSVVDENITEQKLPELPLLSKWKRDYKNPPSGAKWNYTNLPNEQKQWAADMTKPELTTLPEQYPISLPNLEQSDFVHYNINKWISVNITIIVIS